MRRAPLCLLVLLTSACVEPSQARVTETPEQLLNDKDCADYKPVKGVMPGAGAPAKPQPDAERPAASDPCAGATSTAAPGSAAP